MDFRSLKGLQTSKPSFVYAFAGAALVPDFRFLEYCLLRIGTSFQIQNGFYEVNSAQTMKLTAQGSLPDENITEKNRLTTCPVPYLEMLLTSGKSTNFSFIVPVNSRVFCPKINIFNK